MTTAASIVDALDGPAAVIGADGALVAANPGLRDAGVDLSALAALVPGEERETVGADGGLIAWSVRPMADGGRLILGRQATAGLTPSEQYLASLSHELRTPLTPVLMIAGALEHDPDLPPEVREDLAMIKRNVELETKLIDDLLDLSRITSGKVELKPESVDLNDAVRQVCGICQPHLIGAQVRLEMELGEDVGTISADPARLQQVLWNLLKNAIKFSPQGGSVRVTSQRRDSQRC